MKDTKNTQEDIKITYISEGKFTFSQETVIKLWLGAAFTTLNNSNCEDGQKYIKNILKTVGKIATNLSLFKEETYQITLKKDEIDRIHHVLEIYQRKSLVREQKTQNVINQLEAFLKIACSEK